MKTSLTPAEQQFKTMIVHFAEGLRSFASALELMADEEREEKAPATTSNGAGQAPKVKTQEPAPQTQTEVAKRAADKTEKEKPAAKKPKETKAQKLDDAFEAADREGKITQLRERMVLVAQKLNGDKTRTFAFLKKYGANKVAELSDENLGNLKNDVEVFLAGPDALDL